MNVSREMSDFAFVVKSAPEVVADLGVGSGYFTFRIAPKVGKTGRVLAVEIQEEMI
jgi:tRNA A58 N-methylase Trm61